MKAQVTSEFINEKNKDPFSKYLPIEQLLAEMDDTREDVNIDKLAEIIKPVELNPEPPKTDSTEPGQTTQPANDPNKPPVTEPVEPDGQKKVPALIAKTESEWLAKQHDRVEAFICSLIAKEDDPSQFKADTEELQEIAGYIYAWRKESTKPLPNWIMILLAIALIYGPKYKMAFDMRKEKKIIAAQESEIEELRRQISIRDEMLNKNEAA